MPTDAKLSDPSPYINASDAVNTRGGKLGRRFWVLSLYIQGKSEPGAPFRYNQWLVMTATYPFSV